jgi:SPP1 gp7 family putative phage head morphogenesis protein
VKSSQIKTVVLQPIKESTSDYEEIERKIKALFKTEIYLPILKELGEPSHVLTNSADELLNAIKSGRIQFYRGTFSGRFNASISKELKALGASWERKTGTFKLPQSSLPLEVRHAISASESRFQQKLKAIDLKLAQILPEELADKLKIEKQFSSALWKVDKDFHQSVKNITVTPRLTQEQRDRIAAEWQNNMKLWIKDWTQKEIAELRSNMQKSVFAGNRYQSAVKTIQDSYGVSSSKAKFLARQETGLLMAKFKQTRYEKIGVMEYKWEAVTGTKAHPVRPRHKALADASKRGTIYRWDDPPNTAEPGEAARHNNPGEDYNCRCSARPIIRFKETTK